MLTGAICVVVGVILGVAVSRIFDKRLDKVQAMIEETIGGTTDNKKVGPMR